MVLLSSLSLSFLILSSTTTTLTTFASNSPPRSFNPTTLQLRRQQAYQSSLNESNVWSNDDLFHGESSTVDNLKRDNTSTSTSNNSSSNNNNNNSPTITFTDPRASKYYVDGTTIPEVDWDLGPSWSGLIPISDHPHEERKLFFWFYPARDQSGEGDLTFWTNGGPGCSSLEGIFQENGPALWNYGTFKPEKNLYAWNNLSHMLWVEQPIGTGMTQGKPNITNEEELSSQVIGFLNQFLDIFSELKGKNFYLTGESYAGMYVPSIANYIYTHPSSLPSLKLKGIWIADPSISTDDVLAQVPAINFVKQQWENVFGFNDSFLEKLDGIGKKCGYTDFSKKYATYPPNGPLPTPQKGEGDCDVWDLIFEAALEINPAFNVYHVLDTPPILWDVLGFPGSSANEQSKPLYFDREDVKKIIHAPTNVTWKECSDVNVFVGPDGLDTSPPTALSGVLGNVIDKSERTVIVSGLADFIIIEEGTRIAIQNMTWGGKQGFQKPPTPNNFIIPGQGIMGTAHTERKLSYVTVKLSGHMVPQYQPRAAYKQLAYLLGRIPSLEG